MGQSGRSTPGPARAAGEPDRMLAGAEGAARLLCAELGSAPGGLDSSQAWGPELGPRSPGWGMQPAGDAAEPATAAGRPGVAFPTSVVAWQLLYPGLGALALQSSSLICFPSQPAPRCLMSKGSGEAAVGSPWGLWEGGRGPRPLWWRGAHQP